MCACFGLRPAPLIVINNDKFEIFERPRFNVELVFVHCRNQNHSNSRVAVNILTYLCFYNIMPNVCLFRSLACATNCNQQ